MELDLELVSLLLRQYIRVHRLDGSAVIHRTRPSDRFVQFDENYLIEFIRHDAIHAHILGFPRRDLRARLQLFHGLMDEIYWGVEAELEEQAYQFRSPRLADQRISRLFRRADGLRLPEPAAFSEDSRRIPVAGRAIASMITK